MSRYVSLAAAAAVSVGLSFGGPNAEAATLHSITADEGNWFQNDCAGAFGSDFEDCQVADSYVIAKYDFGDPESEPPKPPEWTINDARFPTVVEGDFTIGESPDGTFNWTYSNPNTDLRYWVAKVGASHESGGFTLFWEVAGNPAACADGTFDLDACLLLAIAINSGTYVEGGGQGSGLSHLTFYDTPTSVVPLPAGLVLFLTGLAGVGFLGRYKAKRGEVPTA